MPDTVLFGLLGRTRCGDPAALSQDDVDPAVTCRPEILEPGQVDKELGIFAFDRSVELGKELDTALPYRHAYRVFLVIVPFVAVSSFLGRA